MEKSNVLEILGRNIRQIRLLRSMSQESLASDLQKSVNFVSLLENGKTGISIQTLVDICKVLKVDTNALFSDIVTPPENNVDSFITNSLELFKGEDKAIVSDLIRYIKNSKS